MQDAEKPTAESGRPAPEQLVTFSFSRWLRRREDQLQIRFDFYNLQPHPVPGGAVLRRSSPGPAYVVAVLAPQHLAERTYPDSGGEPADWPVDARLAGPSRLAFAVPEAVAEVPLTESALLAWGQLAASVHPAAAPPPGGAPALGPPQPYHTAIELPWRLLLSPHERSAWAHSTTPVTRDGRTELWHTRLGVAGADGTTDEDDAESRTVRAIWGTDPDFGAWLLPPGSPGAKTPPDGAVVPAPGLPFRMPLTPRDRVQIVRASADHTIAGYEPRPVEVNRLALSGMGGWLDAHGGWDPPANALSILSWRHRATLGRDQDVRVVERGYLLPFGHQASLLEITERKVSPARSGGQVAYLRQRYLLVVRQPTRRYPAFAQADEGRRLPFRSLTVTRVTTPTIDDPQPLVPALGQDAFVPRIGGEPYAFEFSAVDHGGRRVRFTAPVVFVKSTIAFDEPKLAQVRAAYNAVPEADPLRRRPLAGQRLALAASDRPGDTDVAATSLTFRAQAPVGNHGTAAFVAHDQVRCHPAVSAAGIRLPAAEQLSGRDLGEVAVQIDDGYAAHGFDPAQNPAEVYAVLAEPVTLAFDADKAGPFTPAMDIRGLSRTMGPVGGDLQTLKAGSYDLPAIFEATAATPRIMGGVKLSDIVAPVPVTPGAAPEGAMVLRTEHPGGAPQALTGGGDAVGPRQRFELRPKLVSDPLKIIEVFPYTYASIELEIGVDNNDPNLVYHRFQALISNGKPWSKTQDLPDDTEPGPLVGTAPALVLRLVGDVLTFVEVEFQRVYFIAETGKDHVIDFVLGEIRFKGPLELLQRIMDEISGAPKPPGTPQFGKIVHFLPGPALEVGLLFGIPAIKLGVFSLKNLMAGVAVTLPLLVPAVPDGQERPIRLTFYFAERQNPFLLAVQCFGGGGYFAAGFGTDGAEFIEAALEFGAHAELDFVVAAGMIEVMAGLYFRLDIDPGGNQTCTLTGYVRMRGQVSALGIVTISLEMYLGLTYQSAGNKVIGQATVTLAVEVLFFSTSVSLHVERRFSGDENDPTFLDQMPAQSVWDEYAGAFAPLGG
ncbi:hypothetical protein AB0J86_18980 [Micromonospora sp. NPDC049559]|uniref:hypothetical protein n=1 Tax=Micromonospora sp. NPDC049559 TaxID=3155923 RepID=UPI0034400684